MRTTLSILALTVVISGCRTVAPGPAAPPPSTASSRSQTPTPVSGIGNHHHPITTASPDAQKAVDQGFNLVFGFNHEEAVRSFKRAAKLDPKAPMPHWGIAWALGPN